MNASNSMVVDNGHGSFMMQTRGGPQQAARVGGRGDHDNATRAGRRGGCLIMGKINFSNSGLKSVSNLIKEHINILNVCFPTILKILNESLPPYRQLHSDACPVGGVVPDDDHPELGLQLRPFLRPEHQPHQALVSAVRVGHCLEQSFR